ncbi:MAG: hypothetical protein HND47_23440 [Chloroflexi bacterium]|nr:hypothetical protein [Chloroflexota bacterium]
MVHRPVITFLTGGTRGDVLPYIALGEGLREAGCDVRLAAPRGFANLVQPSRLTFAPFDGNPTDLMLEQGDQSPLTLGRHPIQSLRATRNFIRQARPIYRDMLHTAAQASARLRLAHSRLARALGRAHRRRAENSRRPRIASTSRPHPRISIRAFAVSFFTWGNRELAHPLGCDSSHLAFVALRDQPRASRGLWAGPCPWA